MASKMKCLDFAKSYNSKLMPTNILLIIFTKSLDIHHQRIGLFFICGIDHSKLHMAFIVNSPKSCSLFTIALVHWHQLTTCISLPQWYIVPEPLACPSQRS